MDDNDSGKRKERGIFSKANPVLNPCHFFGQWALIFLLMAPQSLMRANHDDSRHRHYAAFDTRRGFSAPCTILHAHRNYIVKYDV